MLPLRPGGVKVPGLAKAAPDQKTEGPLSCTWQTLDAIVMRGGYQVRGQARWPQERAIALSSLWA
jgi:hypothetical protein